MRKHCVPFFLLLWGISLLCAQEPVPNTSGKGASPLATHRSSLITHHSTRAVVIGISDYQDPAIPDLRFAHRDAEAFANFLRSPAGGSLDGDHLKLLTNEQATAGRIAEALDALVEQAKEGDQVLIYFSGHGDVERNIFSQPGFLLCWDAPSRVYMGGGTYSLAYLEAVVTTLSVQNKARVTVITDACHAGKLSGSQIGGAQLTSANLAKQYANEIKILSCQPNEFSLEGEQWGGGRGCFSYHLVDGLFGLADRNEDDLVTVGELDRYLEDHVTAEAAPQSQVPMLLGNKTERLARVNAQLLADLQKNKSGQMPVFAPTESRGLEEEVLAKADSGIRQMYLAFKKAVAEKRFFEPSENCAETFYAVLSGEPGLNPLRGFLTRNYAAALQDDTQTAINDYLRSDHREIRRRWMHDNRYEAFPKYLSRAAGLLGPGHYMYPQLKAREHYFKGLLLRMSGERSQNTALFQLAKSHQFQALELDSNIAFVWNELGLLDLRLGNYSQAIPLFEHAMIYAPAWAMPVANLSGTWAELKDFKAAQKAGLLALSLDSLCPVAHFNLALSFYRQADFKNAIHHYLKALQYDPEYLDAYYNLGLANYWQGDFTAAQTNWLQYASRNPLDWDIHVCLGKAANKLGKKEEAGQYFQAAIALDAAQTDPLLSMAHLLHDENKTEEAFRYIELAIQKKATFGQLKKDPDLAPLRALPEWRDLMKKHFPDQVKD